MTKQKLFYPFSPTCTPLGKKTLVFLFHFSRCAKISVFFTLRSGKQFAKMRFYLFFDPSKAVNRQALLFFDENVTTQPFVNKPQSHFFNTFAARSVHWQISIYVHFVICDSCVRNGTKILKLGPPTCTRFWYDGTFILNSLKLVI